MSDRSYRVAAHFCRDGRSKFLLTLLRNRWLCGNTDKNFIWARPHGSRQEKICRKIWLHP